MQNIRLNKFGVALIVLVLLSLGVAVFFYLKSGDAQSSQSKTAEAENIVLAVSKLIMLPEGESPTVATVSDAEKVRDQPFFANAKSGDKVLIYIKARKAYLYDPIAKKLVEVAPLSADNSLTGTTTTQ